jgi:DNA-directed RNA polymerase specialized sigma24 family protein
MKSAIADRHRQASAAKRPPEVSLDLVHETLSSSNPDLVTDYGLYWAFSQATSRISQTDPLLAEILELRFLVGLSVPEAAALLDYSDRHMRRLWAEAVQKLEDVVKTQ